MRSNMEIAQELRQIRRDFEQHAQAGRTYLFCSYSDKETVKSLGGIWDAARSQWYVPHGKSLLRFKKWLERTPTVNKTSGKFLVSKYKNSAAHYWTGSDTACKLYSTSSMNKKKYKTSDTSLGKKICHMCQVNNKKLLSERVDTEYE